MLHNPAVPFYCPSGLRNQALANGWKTVKECGGNTNAHSSISVTRLFVCVIAEVPTSQQMVKTRLEVDLKRFHFVMP